MAKGTPIHVHLLDDPDVKRFAEVAEEVCDVFERVDDLSKIEFLQQLEELLPLIYSQAHRLPDPFNWEDDNDDEPYERGPEGMSHAERMARWKELRQRVTARLGWHSLVHFVYDPVSVDERDAISADLADMLAEVYLDLKNGLSLYTRSTDEDRAQGLWDWRFHLGLGWGRHVAEALLPIHSLIHNHYDEDDEVFEV